MTTDEALYIDEVKKGLVDAMAAYAKKEDYHKSFSGIPTVVVERHPWRFWKKTSYTIPAPAWMNGDIEIYNTGEYVDTGDTDHFVIHLWFAAQWVEKTVVDFLAEHDYKKVEHGHYISLSVPRHWQQCGRLAFEPSE